MKKYRQISNTIRLRHKALDELYENIKIKTITENGGKSVKSVLRLFKELYEQKGIIQKPLPMSFWDTLKLSVDGEFQGIATFVEQKYPDLSSYKLARCWTSIKMAEDGTIVLAMDIVDSNNAQYGYLASFMWSGTKGYSQKSSWPQRQADAGNRGVQLR